jgi:Carboxypeptidase regulatory-like domain
MHRQTPRSARSLLWSLLLACLLAWPAQGQSDGLPTTAQLRGKVVNQHGHPIAGVQVVVQGGGSTTTAADGTFTITQIPPGPHLLHVAARGYHAINKVIQLPAGANRSVLIEFVPHNKPHPNASASPALADPAESPTPAARGTLYVRAEPFRRGNKLFKVERISVRDYESGHEWRQHFYSEGEDASGVSLSCDGATVGGKCKIHVSWRAVHHRKSSHDDDYDDHDENSWDREVSHDGQSETFYNP